MNHPLKGEEHILPHSCRTWLQEAEIGTVFLMKPKGDDHTPLESELKQLLPNSKISVVELPRIGLDSNQTPSELAQLPWAIIRKIFQFISPLNDSTLLLGRGAGIYDHALWLAGQCLTQVTTIHIDSCSPVLSTKNVRQNHSPVEKTVLPGMITAYLEDIKNNRQDVENYGYIDSERFMNVIHSTVQKGIAPSLHEMEKVGGIEKFKSGKDTTYRLNPVALSDAASTYQDEKVSTDEDLPSLTIAFGRVPKIQTKNNEQKPKFDFFNYLNPLQPMDGLLVVLQRFDDSIPDSSIMTLERALIEFEGHADFIGDLRIAHNVLFRRALEDDIDTHQHMVVINPKPDVEFQMMFFLHLLAYCEEFEKKHGLHRWDIDLTMPINSIRSSVSFFADITNTSPTYVLKSKFGNDKIPRRSLVLSLPGRVAREAFEKLLNPHGNSTGSTNCLIGMFQNENEKGPENTVLSIKERMKQLKKQENNNPIAIKATDLKKYLESNGLNDGIKNIHRTLNRLIGWRLVVKLGLHYSLTDLGRFVAEQIDKIREGGVRDIE